MICSDDEYGITSRNIGGGRTRKENDHEDMLMPHSRSFFVVIRVVRGTTGVKIKYDILGSSKGTQHQTRRKIK